MSRPILTLLLLASAAVPALAASAVNDEDEARTITVTEGAEQRRVTVEPGASLMFCPDGCFVTMPNGDRYALSGDETIALVDGGGRLQ